MLCKIFYLVRNLNIYSQTFLLVPLKLLVCCLAHRGSTGVFPLLQVFCDVLRYPGFSIVGQLIVSVSPHFLFILDLIMIYLFVYGDSLTT